MTPIEPDPELDLLDTAWRSARTGELHRELRGLGDSGIDEILCRTGDAARLTNSKRVLVEVCLVTPNKSKTEIKEKKRKKKERLKSASSLNTTASKITCILKRNVLASGEKNTCRTH